MVAVNNSTTNHYTGSLKTGRNDHTGCDCCLVHRSIVGRQSARTGRSRWLAASLSKAPKRPFILTLASIGWRQWPHQQHPDTRYRFVYGRRAQLWIRSALRPQVPVSLCHCGAPSRCPTASVFDHLNRAIASTYEGIVERPRHFR